MIHEVFRRAGNEKLLLISCSIGTYKIYFMPTTGFVVPKSPGSLYTYDIIKGMMTPSAVKAPKIA